MRKEFLKDFAKKQIGEEVYFDSFACELQKLGFEDIFDSYDEDTLKDVLESGVCYYVFVKNIGINEENEELDGVKLRLEFDVTEWNTEDETIGATLLKISDCNIE
ncbi:MAG: hypothetical protein E6936_15950 [Clostridium perfringens]|nr:hypothetical protein [Clostridium perfringens]